jgi:hypothetical protein
MTLVNFRALSLFAVLLVCGCGTDTSETNVSASNLALADAQPSGTSDAAQIIAVRDTEVPSRADGATFTGLMISSDGTPVTVRYNKVGDLAVAGGDMIVGTHVELQLRQKLFKDLEDGQVDSFKTSDPRRLALQSYGIRAQRAGDGNTIERFSPNEMKTLGWGTTGKLWPSTSIAYEIGASIPAGARRAVIADAVQKWNAQSPVKLRPSTELTSSQRAQAVILTFVDHEDPDEEFACASWVGYRPKGGRQEVFLNPECRAGNIMHEIGHALGLHHEHQRSDRGKFITVNDNVPQDSVNYSILNGRRLSDHDLCSVMHYGPGEESWYTLTAAGQSAYEICEQQLDEKCRTTDPGQRCQLSNGDVASIKSFYGL